MIKLAQSENIYNPTARIVLIYTQENKTTPFSTHLEVANDDTSFSYRSGCHFKTIQLAVTDFDDRCEAYGIKQVKI